jgi:hypothetical protein
VSTNGAGGQGRPDIVSGAESQHGTTEQEGVAPVPEGAGPSPSPADDAPAGTAGGDPLAGVRADARTTPSAQATDAGTPDATDAGGASGEGA